MIANVLFVEDDESVAHPLIDLMSNAFNMLHVKSIAEARRAFENGRVIDVVILDLCLEDSKGAKTVRRIVEMVPGIPIVIFSGTTDPEEIDAALKAGAQRFISKGEKSAALINITLLLAIEQQKRTSLEKKEAGMHAELMVARQKISEVMAELQNAFQFN